MEVLKLVQGISAEQEGDYDDDVLSSITDSYFLVDESRGLFPELILNENTVPAGNTKPYCFHIDWSIHSMQNVLDRYISVKGQTTCSAAQNSKVRWQERDPKDGFEFHPWLQHKIPADNADKCPDNALFVASPDPKKKGSCY